MKTLNNYGFVSGGYLFDRMDRIAQKAAIKKSFFRKRYAMTKNAHIEYQKQCCDVRDLRFVVVTPVEKSKRKWVGAVYAMSRTTKTTYATATFEFAYVDKNYCETKD